MPEEIPILLINCSPQILLFSCFFDDP